MSAPVVRTRVAPSPTGDPHIGTAYMALFNLAFAKSQGGQFLLRIEDTDQTRSTRASEQAIFDALRWLGLQWDEGPDVGGPCGPYRQSERLDIYKQYVQQLIESGHAYPCFCTSERLEALRQQQTAEGGATQGYDGLCGQLDPLEAQRRMAAGEPYVVRLRVPREGECVVPDRLRGEIRIPWTQVDAQVLQKTDGFPTYHLANVVDDHLMGITHVIRGEEWISSAPKHVLLYQAFGWQAPEFIHLPLLRNPDKSKLSKRKNPTGIFFYQRAGYLPEAVLNYLGLMAYTMADEREMFSLEEFMAAFDIDRVSLGGPIFDLAKLNWLNGRYLREALTPVQIVERLKAWQLNDALLERLMPLAQKRMDKLSDFMPLVAFMFADRPDYDPKSLLVKGLQEDQVAPLLRIVLWECERAGEWTADALKAIFTRVTEIENLKMREVMPLFFVAITGASSSIPLFDAMELLGSEMSRRRLQYALEALASAGLELKGKTLKKLEKDYQYKYRA